MTNIISISLDQHMVDKLDAECNGRGITRSKGVLIAIKKWLNDAIDDDEHIPLAVDVDPIVPQPVVEPTDEDEAIAEWKRKHQN